MAARLLLLKSRALLPRAEPAPGSDGGAADDADARDLVDRLTVYKAFAGIAGRLRGWQEEGRAGYGRPDVGALPEYLLAPPLDGAEEQAALVRAALRCLRRARRREERAPRTIPPSTLDLDFRAVLAEVAGRIAAGPVDGQRFETLLPAEAPVLMIVAVFLAILELVRRSAARLVQEEPFGPLLVRPIPEAAPTLEGA
jgi:segregation and condensation protein A